MVKSITEWLKSKLPSLFENDHSGFYEKIFEQSKQIENEQRKQYLKTGYDQGYMDGQCNHVNDADNFVNEQEFINQ